MRNVADKTVEKMKIHIPCSVPLFSPIIVLFMEKSGRVKQAGADNTTRSVRFACRTNKALIQKHKQTAELLSLFHGYNFF
jgi:hypothetical protein